MLSKGLWLGLVLGVIQGPNRALEVLEDPEIRGLKLVPQKALWAQISRRGSPYFIISQDDGHFQDDASWQGPLTSWPARMMGPKFGAQLWGPIWASILGPKFGCLPCVHKAC